MFKFKDHWTIRSLTDDICDLQNGGNNTYMPLKAEQGTSNGHAPTSLVLCPQYLFLFCFFQSSIG